MMPGLSKLLQREFNILADLLVAVKDFKKSMIYTVFTNGGHAGKHWCLVMKARRWRINKNCK